MRQSPHWASDGATRASHVGPPGPLTEPPGGKAVRAWPHWASDGATRHALGITGALHNAVTLVNTHRANGIDDDFSHFVSNGTGPMFHGPGEAWARIRRRFGPSVGSACHRPWPCGCVASWDGGDIFMCNPVELRNMQPWMKPKDQPHRGRGLFRNRKDTLFLGFLQLTKKPRGSIT